MEVYADSKQKPGRAVQGTSGSGLPAISGIPTRTEYYPACVHSTLQPSLPAALLSCDSRSTRKIGQYVCRHRISKTPEGVDYQISDFRRSSCCLVSGGRSSIPQSFRSYRLGSGLERVVVRTPCIPRSVLGLRSNASSPRPHQQRPLSVSAVHSPCIMHAPSLPVGSLWLCLLPPDY